MHWLPTKSDLSNSSPLSICLTLESEGLQQSVQIHLQVQKNNNHKIQHATSTSSMKWNYTDWLVSSPVGSYNIYGTTIQSCLVYKHTMLSNIHCLWYASSRIRLVMKQILLIKWHFFIKNRQEECKKRNNAYHWLTLRKYTYCKNQQYNQITAREASYNMQPNILEMLSFNNSSPLLQNSTNSMNSMNL